jgi:hypothetical protein
MKITNMKQYTSSMKLALPVALGIALSLASGCSKHEPASVDHAETKAPEVQSAPSPASAASAQMTTAVTPQKSEVLRPVPEEMMALIASNRTESVQVQVYYITNSSFTDVQKAQTLMLILPSFTTRDDQRAVAHAAADYVSDATHSLISQPLIEGKLNPQLLSIFMTDTLKRSDGIKIPVLKKIAATQEHPLQAEAQDLLMAFSKTPAVQQ